LWRAAKVLSGVRRVSETAAWKWVRKLGEKVSIKPPRIVRRLIALDETCVKANGSEYWVYTAIDVDRNEIISRRVFPSGSSLATKLFLEEVLKYCEGEPSFTVDSAPRLTAALKETGLGYNVESFRR